MPPSFVSSLSFPFSTHPLHPLVHCFPLQGTLLSLLFDFLLISWLLSIASQLHCFCIFSPNIYCSLVRLEQIVFSFSWWSVGAWAPLLRISLWWDQNPEMEAFLWSIIRNIIDLEMNIPGIYVPGIRKFKIIFFDSKQILDINDSISERVCTDYCVWLVHLLRNSFVLRIVLYFWLKRIYWLMARAPWPSPVRGWWQAAGRPRWSLRTRWRWSCPSRPPRPHPLHPRWSWSTQTVASCVLKIRRFRAGG